MTRKNWNETVLRRQIRQQLFFWMRWAMPSICSVAAAQNHVNDHPHAKPYGMVGGEFQKARA
jgi:hypothetical protein